MKSVADWLQRGYTEAVLMETGMRRNECMKRLSKVSCGLLLTASLLIGAMLSGCGQTTDYTAEIKEYQNKLESLAAENEELKAQLGITETQSTEETQTAAETENQSQEMVSENQTDQTGAQQAENTDNSGDEMKILVLGDSIWMIPACLHVLQHVLLKKGKMRRSITVPSAAPAQPSARTIMNTSLVLPVTAPWER